MKKTAINLILDSPPKPTKLKALPLYHPATPSLLGIEKDLPTRTAYKAGGGHIWSGDGVGGKVLPVLGFELWLSNHNSCGG
jgi:hypothetical protein